MSEESKPVAPGGASELARECKDTSPAWWVGRWMDWHRGHGCAKDDGQSVSPEGVDEFHAAGRLPGRVAADAAIAALKPDLESCRSRLSTAEKETAALRLLLFLRHGCSWPALYGDDGEMQCHACALDFRRMSPAEIEARWRDAGLAALSRGPVADAPEAPKASEIASDSSALEKALGALRAARTRLAFLVCCILSGELLNAEDVATNEALFERIDLALSGGAHVDGPKAPQESFNQRTARAGLGHGPAPIDEDYPDALRALKEEVK